jgi:hypothetical protein
MRNALTLFLALPLAGAALAAVPGTSGNPVAADRDLNTVVITETGHITLSSDGLGTMSDSGLLQVQKPSAGATVRAAYLAAASTGGSGYEILDGCLTLNGGAVNWSAYASQPYPFLNYWANVTSLVATTLNAAPAGIVDLVVTECNTYGVDGEALYVIFDDPATTITRTAVIAFGAQLMAGDQFHIGFGQPVTVDGNTVIEMGLADSYSYQVYSCQTSYIDVNGVRMTSAAGGNDDGDYADGALMTVGGIGDSRSNPADPNYFCGGDDTFYDDELYNIAGYVNTGDTGVTVTTVNPDYTDNIFAAHLLLDFAAVIGEGAVLTPAQAINCLCEPHTVTLTVQNDNGEPVGDTPAAIWVESGPGAPAFVQGLTNGAGQISLTYTSCTEGMDVIVGNFYNSENEWELSNRATKVWERCDVGAGETPAGFNLAQNTPNPFNPSTTISFSMPETGAAKVLVHSLMGELVRTLDLGIAPRGQNHVLFDGSNLASGVYLYTLQSEFGSQTRKMVLVK